MTSDIEEIVKEITLSVDPKLKHNDTVGQINQIFRKRGFYTTLEYPIFKIQDKNGRKGRIDLVARKGKFRVAVEYDHKYNVKWKSFQKVVQIKPEVAIAITGFGELKSNMERAEKYRNMLKSPLYIISLRSKSYIQLKNEGTY